MKNKHKRNLWFICMNIQKSGETYAKLPKNNEMVNNNKIK